MDGLIKVGIIPDSHRPWHSRRAMALCLEVFAFAGVDQIYLLGDYADFYCIHQHGVKDPRLPGLLEREVEDVNQGLDELDKFFPDAIKTYIQGNHEYRLERIVMNNVPQLFGYIDIQDLLKIRTRPNWRFVSYGPQQKVQVAKSKLWARHEPLGSSAKATASKALCSLVYGHIHRIEESQIVGMDGKSHVSFSVGWLGDKRQEKVFGYVKQHHQWQQGFGIVYVDPVTKFFYHQKVQILDNNTCVFNGHRFKA